MSAKYPVVNMLSVSVMAMAMLTAAQASQGQTFTVLHTFAGGANDGSTPSGNLIISGNTLYGTTAGGGSSGKGTIFSFDLPSNNLSVMYSFKGGQTDASSPLSLLKSGSVFYGVTQVGVNSCQGSVFAYDSSANTETVLHNFVSVPDGLKPIGALVQSGDVLYGLTSSGNGSIFAYDTSTGIESVVHSFGTPTGDGVYPTSLMQSGNLLYGTTASGGQHWSGTIFTFNPANNNESVLYSFAGGSTDGRDPEGALIRTGNTFYGTTIDGGDDFGLGTVFALDTNTNTETMMYRFAYCSDGIPPWGANPAGARPYGSLTQSGEMLYGRTEVGGTQGGGTVFALDTTTGVRTVLHSFPSYTTISDLVLSDDTLYGVASTSSNGYSNDYIFSLTVPEPCSLSILLLGSLLLARRRGRAS